MLFLAILNMVTINLPFSRLRKPRQLVDKITFREVFFISLVLHLLESQQLRLFCSAIWIENLRKRIHARKDSVVENQG